jgi:hypothetical protein
MTNHLNNRKDCIVFLLTILIYFYSSISINGQILNKTNIAIPPSPNASALLEYVNVPVDYYTGVPDIDVPLYTLAGRDINIPIGVSYHASGIKVQDVASSVGLGWNLYAGGAITRVVRGLPDGSFTNCGTNLSNSLYWGVFLNDGCDHESDIFYFNFLGQTGKFFLDETLVPYQSPEGYSKIIPIADGVELSSVPIARNAPTVVGSTQPGSRWSWKIIDENGYQYYFGESQASSETSTLWKTNNNAYFQDKSFISTWYLTRIISPKGILVANFTYSAGAPTSTEYFSSFNRKLVKTLGDCGQIPDESTTNTNIKVVVQNPLYPSWITTSLGSANFSFIGSRRDITGSYLDKISIFDLNSMQVKSYSFQYGYFTGTKAKLGNAFGFGCSLAECVLRLKLTSIADESLTKLREFVYNEEVDLPQRQSNYIDHWGYYNYTTTNYPPSIWQAHTRIPFLDFNDPSLPINGTSSAGLGAFPGGRKFAEPGMASANVLTTIKYPTGGSTVFEYEGNYTPEGMGGGLRIKSIKDFSGPSALVGTRTYVYQQGKKYRDPVYHYLIVGNDINQACLAQFCWSTACQVTNLIRNSSSLCDLFDLNGASVGYGKVTETLLDNSRVERYYTNFDSRPDSEPEIKIYMGRFSTYDEVTTIPTDTYGPPFSPKTSYAWERSLLSAEKVFDNNSKLLTESQYNYDFSLPSKKLILNKAVESTSQISTPTAGGPTINNLVRVATYYINIKPINLLNISKKVYSQTPISGSSPLAYPCVTSTTVINKHPVYQSYVQSIVTTLSDGAQTKTEYRYVFDISADINNIRSSLLSGLDARAYGLGQLRAQNAISSPIEIINFYKKPGSAEIFKVIGADLKTYIKHPTLGIAMAFEEYTLQTREPTSDFLPSYIGQLPNGIYYKDTRYRLINKYTHDNTALTLTRQDPSSGVPTSYDWGFNNTLITAANINPGTNQFRTEYVNKPLVGLETIRDANFQTVNYEYDRSNRLKIVKDTDGNIVQRYRYHYKDGMDNVIDFKYLTYSSSATHNTVQFIAQGAGEPGSSLMWDFGNGTVQENGTSSQLQTYTTPGFYDVKLVTTHPEYSPSTVAKKIRILPPANAQITSPIVGTNRTVCGSQPTTCTVATTEGPYAYQWEYNYSGSGSGNFLPIGTNSPTLVFANSGVQNSSSSIRCKVTDAAGNSRYSSYITIFHYCAGQPGPGDCPAGWSWNSQGGYCEPPAGSCGEGCFWNGFECVCP